MVLLVCAIVGVDSGAFTVEIDMARPVDALKKLVKENSASRMPETDHEIQLYTTHNGSRWLTEDALSNLQRGDHPDISFIFGKPPMKATRPIASYLQAFVEWHHEVVHVLAVMVPTSVWSLVNETSLDEPVDDAVLLQYYETADRLRSMSEVKDLAAVVLRTANHPQPPFIIVHGSNGVGKTQMAFNLKARDEFDLVYLSALDSQEPMHNSLQTRCNTFYDCVKKDLEERKMLSGGLGKIQMQGVLRTFGFIWTIARGESMYKGPRRYDEVLSAMQARSKPLAVFLDRFPHASKYESWDKDRRSCFIRDVFRACKIVVLVASDSCSAKDLTYGHPAKQANKSWCVIAPTFPPFDSGVQHAVMPRYLETIVQRSRPVFAKCALQLLQKNRVPDEGDAEGVIDFMEMLVEKVKDTQRETLLHTHFCLLLSPHAIIGQSEARLASCQYKQLRNIEDKQHFGLQFNAAGLLVKNTSDQPWDYRTKFPEIDDEVLLYLAFNGGKKYLPFKYVCNSEQFIDTLRRYEITQMLSHLPRFLGSKTDAGDKVPTRLEAIVSSAIVLASHFNGLRGVSLYNFVQRLLFELGYSSSNTFIPTRAVDSLVPFLAPPDRVWPEWLPQALNLGHLTRVVSDKRVVLDLAGGICSVELICDREWSGNAVAVRELLMRVPETSAVHVVAMNSIESGWFERQELAALVKKTMPHKNTRIYCARRGQSVHLALDTASINRSFSPSSVDKTIILLEPGVLLL